MSESRNNDEDFNEWSPWEQQTLLEIQRGDVEAVFVTNSEATLQKLYASFQGAAQCLAVLYKVASDTRPSNPALWPSFQTAASTITSHHKACVEYIRNCEQIALEAGSHRRTRDLLTWSKRRRIIRREELIAFLAGKSPPPKAHHNSYRGSCRARVPDHQRPRPRLPPSPHSSLPHSQEQDLNTFREALGIAGSPTTLHRRRSHLHELQSFLADEFTRNKRPAPSPSPPNASHDVCMDSPQHKRFKYT
ncbi:telomere attrition and p53 response 1 protein [Hyalella azteca]|uniref:Telomere attrition and p53 response 1 protein n=1 Tax=Hyalella azteca TaxID=294128 RepID=A0A8B7PQM9_HYAAZ|nr:telomere attrition and p53 response 1 protein [Hyalella azteca]